MVVAFDGPESGELLLLIGAEFMEQPTLKPRRLNIPILV
jgi:hypothetical protein